jgi:hypothetical protein
MPVRTRDALYTAQKDGKVHFFCADGCRQHWMKENSCCSGSKGWWGRYLDRLGKANTGEYGASGPKCH